MGQDRRSMLEVGCSPSGRADVASSRPTPTWQGILREPWATAPQRASGRQGGTHRIWRSLWRIPWKPRSEWRGNRQRGGEDMLIPCPECNHRVSQDATSCPNCGRPFADQELARLIESKYKRGQRQQIGFIVLVAILGLLIWASSRGGEREPPSTRQSDRYQAEPAKPAVTEAAPNRQTKLKAWVGFVRTDPEMKKVVQRVEVHPGSAGGIGVTVYLKPGSAIGKAAAKDPAAEPVELAAKMLAAHLWDYCRDNDLREVNVGICLGKRDVGVAATGYMNGEVTTIYLPTGILDK